jgi:hypothetical protein
MPDYRKGQVTTLVDLVELQQQLDLAEIYEDEEGNKIQTIYLGSILDLTPSGKFYTPFAHSNVDGCPRCNGNGMIKNKHGKKKKYALAQRKHLTLLKQINHYDTWANAPTKLRKAIHKAYKQETWLPPSFLYGMCRSW